MTVQSEHIEAHHVDHYVVAQRNCSKSCPMHHHLKCSSMTEMCTASKDHQKACSHKEIVLRTIVIALMLYQ